MTISSISLPLMVAIPAAAYLLTGGDMRQTILSACFTAIGILAANLVHLR